MQMAIWRTTDGGPQPLTFSQLGLESRLEDMIARDTSLLGMDLLMIGRQVQTRHGGYLDLLVVDSDGHLHVLELKRPTRRPGMSLPESSTTGLGCRA